MAALAAHTAALRVGLPCAFQVATAFSGAPPRLGARSGLPYLAQLPWISHESNVQLVSPLVVLSGSPARHECSFQVILHFAISCPDKIVFNATACSESNYCRIMKHSLHFSRCWEARV